MTEKAKSELYIWHGHNAKGEKISGELSAASLILAKATIRRLGITLQSVKKKKRGLFASAHDKKLNPSDNALLLRQLSALLNAGIPVVQSLEMVQQAQANDNGKKMLLAIKTDIESGTPFSKALRRYPANFSALSCNLLAAGEQAGSLDHMLDRVASYAEKSESLKKKIKKALTYPLAVISIAILITTGLLIFIIPTFKEVYAGFNAELPMATRAVIALSDYIRKYGWIAIIGFILSLYLLKKSYQKNTPWVEKIDRWSLRLPIIGTILEKAAIARFARTLATTFAAGLPLVDALQSVAAATGNFAFNKATLRIRDEVSHGLKIQRAMSNTHLFPPLVVQMVGVGEDSGSLDLMLSKVADFYEEDVNHAVDNLSALLEPLLMVILGVLIGGLVIALYLPLFKLGAVIR
jgi:type IV pilus assembly protein PilC